MPKPQQGVAVAESTKRIELSYLFKSNIILKGKERHCTLRWSNNFNQDLGSINIHTYFKDDEKWIELSYTFTNNYTGYKSKEQYKVYLEGVPSNLGNGEVYYFVCPSTGRLCRILYSAYGSSRFKSRYAYKFPIYYRSQVCSKSDYWNTRYFKVVEQLEKMKGKRINSHYRGKATLRRRKITDKEIQVMMYDKLRWGILAGRLQKLKSF